MVNRKHISSVKAEKISDGLSMNGCINLLKSKIKIGDKFKIINFCDVDIFEPKSILTVKDKHPNVIAMEYTNKKGTFNWSYSYVKLLIMLREGDIIEV